MAIRNPCDAQHRLPPPGAEGERIAYVREKGDEKITVIINAGNEPMRYPLQSIHTDLLTDRDYSDTVSEHSVVILKQKSCKEKK